MFLTIWFDLGPLPGRTTVGELGAAEISPVCMHFLCSAVDRNPGDRGCVCMILIFDVGVDV